MKIVAVLLGILFVVSCSSEYVKLCNVKTYIDYTGGISSAEILDNNQIRVGTTCPF
jgi:hypothetical protein